MNKIAVLGIVLCLTQIVDARHSNEKAQFIKTSSSCLKGKRPSFIGEGQMSPDLKRVKAHQALLMAAKKEQNSTQ